MELDIIFYFFLLFIVTTIGLLKFLQLSVAFRLLTIFVLSAFISELIARLLAWQVGNSCPPYHFFCLANYWLFAGVYHSLLTSQAAKRLVKISCLFFTLIAVLISLFVQPLSDIPLYNIIISNLLYIVMSLTLFLQMLEQPTMISLLRQSVFWMNIAILIYAVIMPICIGLMTYMVMSRRYSEIVMNFNEIVTYIYYGILGYAIYLDRHKTAQI